MNNLAIKLKLFLLSDFIRLTLMIQRADVVNVEEGNYFAHIWHALNPTLLRSINIQ